MPSIIAILLLSIQISGVVVDHKGAVVAGATVTARGEGTDSQTVTDYAGRFSLDIPDAAGLLTVDGPYVQTLQRTLQPGTTTDNLRIEVEYRIPPIHQSIVITASALEPQVETH